MVLLTGRCVCFNADLMQMLVVYLPWLQQVFQTEALSPNDLAFIVFVASSMVALDTARKLLFPDRQGETSVSASSFASPLVMIVPSLDEVDPRTSAIVKYAFPPAELRFFVLRQGYACTHLDVRFFPVFCSPTHSMCPW